MRGESMVAFVVAVDMVVSRHSGQVPLSLLARRVATDLRAAQLVAKIGAIDRCSDEAIHLGPAAGKPVDLVRVGNPAQVLVARTTDVALAVDYRFAGVRRVGNGVPERLAEAAPANELEAPLHAHPVDSQIVNVVLKGPGVDNEIGR